MHTIISLFLLFCLSYIIFVMSAHRIVCLPDSREKLNINIYVPSLKIDTRIIKKNIVYCTFHESKGLETSSGVTLVGYAGWLTVFHKTGSYFIRNLLPQTTTGPLSLLRKLLAEVMHTSVSDPYGSWDSKLLPNRNMGFIKGYQPQLPLKQGNGIQGLP